MENILLSKLCRPEVTSKIVKRKFLDQFNEKTHGKDLILVAAPPGTGKSTSINLALDQMDLPIIWYSLDDWDNDLEMFLGYIFHGLKSVDEDKSKALIELINNVQSVGMQNIIRNFLVYLQNRKERLVLVLDDYHVIHDPSIHDFIMQILQYGAKGMQIIMLTRIDPPISFSKMRVQNKIYEIRIHQLRFDEKEVAAFFDLYKNITISQKGIEILTEKSEGWIASLQLAQLSMEHLDDTQEFVEHFGGQHLHLMDYLIDEVLNRMEETLLDFILKTSLFDYFSSSLIDYVLEEKSGFALEKIEILKQKNLFIIPLDHQNQWYRYHHLFREFAAQKSLLKHNNKQTSILQYYLRAGEYHTSKGETQEAIKYYLRAEDYQKAAHLIELVWSEMDVNLQASRWIKLVEQLPFEIIEKRPVLALGYGWALLDTGSFMECFKWFETAKDLYEQYQKNPKGLLVSDKEQMDLLLVSLESAYGYIAAATDDNEALFIHANNALKGLPERAYYKRGVIAMLMAFSKWHNGDLEEAEVIIRESIKQVRIGVNVLTEHSFYMVQALLLIRQGKLNQAEQILLKSLNESDSIDGIKVLRASFAIYLAEIEYLKGNTPLAYKWLEKSHEYSQTSAIMDYEYRYYYLLSKVYLSENLMDMAYDAYRESERTYFMNPIPDDMTLSDYKKRLEYGINPQLTFEKPDEPLAYMNRISTQCYLDYVLKSADLEDKLFGEAEDICLKCLEQAKKQKRYADEIAFLIFKVRFEKKKQIKSVNTEFVPLVELYGYKRPLLEWGTELLADDKTQKEDELDYYKVNESLNEPLTLRELDVLELIIEGLSNQEISERLFLALSTVKSYIQNIYGKLEVKRRTECVNKARSIHLMK